MSGLFGGGSKAAPAPPPVPPPAPPIVQTSQDVVTAERDQKRIAAKRKGLAKTVLGGADNAGGTSYTESVGQRTLLGGG